MPPPALPSNVEHKRLYTTFVQGVKCNVHVFEETYSSLFGLLKWKARRVRVDVGEPDVRLRVNNRKHRDFWPGAFFPLPDLSKHIAETLDQTKELIDQ
jgi:hypothetical protein